MSPNLAASVRARLLNVAKAQESDFNQVLVRFALERILYRLTQSKYADRFLLKGALLFTLWYDMPHRATRDADLLGFGASATHEDCEEYARDYLAWYIKRMKENSNELETFVEAYLATIYADL